MDGEGDLDGEQKHEDEEKGDADDDDDDDDADDDDDDEQHHVRTMAMTTAVRNHVRLDIPINSQVSTLVSLATAPIPHPEETATLNLQPSSLNRDLHSRRAH